MIAPMRGRASALLGVPLAVFVLLALAGAVKTLWGEFSVAGLGLALTWLATMAWTARHIGERATPWHVVALVAVLSLVLRVMSLSLTWNVALGADPMNYGNLARAVLDGRGLVTSDWQYGEGLRAYFPPLYPLLLAATWALLGAGGWSTMILHIAIDAATALVLASVGRVLGKAAAGRFAGLAWFAWPAVALAGGLPQKEGLTMLCAVLVLRAMVGWLTGERGWRPAAGLGVAWGLLALTQPSLAPFPPVLGLVLAARAGWRPATAFLLAALPWLVLVLAPWWLRNWQVFGSFVPLTTASGMMLNSALGEHRAPFPPGLFDLAEPLRSAIMGKLALAQIHAEPVRFGVERLQAIARGFMYEEAPLAAFRHGRPPITPGDHAFLAPVAQLAFLALLVASFATVWREWRRRHDSLIAEIVIATLGLVMVTAVAFEFGERHRLLLTPLLLLLCAPGLLRYGCISCNTNRGFTV